MKLLATHEEMATMIEALTADNIRLRTDNERIARELGERQMADAARAVEPQCVACGLKRSQESSVCARGAFDGEVRCNDCAQKAVRARG